MPKDITFTDSAGVAKAPDAYDLVRIDVDKAIQSYQLSLYSYEVLTPDGDVRGDDALSEKQRGLRVAVRAAIDNGEALTYPVAGFGMNDNFELGAGRDVFTTLALEGWREIPVHIRKGARKDLAKFILD